MSKFMSTLLMVSLVVIYGCGKNPVQTAGVAAPKTPVLSYPANGVAGLVLTDTLKWATVSGATIYYVQVSISSAFETILFEDSTFTTTKALNSLSNSTQYYWRVQAKNAGGVSDWSTIWSFTTAIAAPSTPTLIFPADGATNKSVTPTIAWSAVTGATTYRIQVSTSSSFASSFIDDSTISTDTMVLTGLANSTTYYWRVRAKNISGVSTWSGAWSFATIVAIPQVPVLSSPADGNTGRDLTDTLTWSTIIGATSYHVQVSTSSTFATILVEDSALTSASKILSGLSNSTQYYWRVQAKNAVGVSGYTSAYSFTTIIAAPQTPVLSSPANGVTGMAITDTLTWSTVTGAATYHVQVSTNSTFASVLIEDSTLTSASKMLSGLANSTTYYWRVQAKNAGGVSAWTTAWNFTTIIAAPITPTLTAPVNGTTGMALKDTLTWSTVTGATSYHVQVSTSSMFTTILIEDSSLTTTTKILSGLSNSTTYYWRVQAKNAGGVSGYTSVWNFITIALPQTPTLATPVNGATGLALTDTLTWSTVTGAATYHVQVSTSNAFATILVEDSVLTSVTKTISGLSNSTQYYWRVQAKNAGGVSAWTTAWSFTTIIAAPIAPTLATPVNGAAGLALTDTLKWSTVTGATSYHMQVSTSSTFTTILVEDSMLINATKIISGLSNSTQYYWRVQAKNAGGVSGYGNIWNFTTIALPLIPTLATPANGATGLALTDTLTWSTVSNATSYHVQVSTSSTFATILIDDSILTSAKKIISGLSNSIMYYWRVQAKNAGGVSGYTSVWNFTTIALPLIPTLTTPVNGATGLTLKDTLTWSTVTGATSYHVQVSTSSTFATILIEDSSLTTASKIISGLSNSIMYYWRVQAKNVGGVSGYTNAWNFTTIIAAPMMPTLSSPINGSTGLALTDTLKWSTVTGATSYHVQVSTSSTFATILIEDSSLTTATKIISGLSSNTTYYWRVQAKNTAGVSGYTNAWNFITHLWTVINNGITQDTVITLAASGSNVFAGTDAGIFLTTNNGTSWSAVNTGLSNLNVHAIAISGDNIFVGTDSGVSISSNNGTSWTTAKSGLTNTKVLEIAVSDTNIFAGTNSGIFLSVNNGVSWSAVNTGLTNTQINALAVSGSHIFAGTYGGVFISANNGTSWTAANSGITNAMVVTSLAVNGSNIFAGVWGNSGVYLSTNNGTSWVPANSGITNIYLHTLAVSGNNVFAGTYGGGVFLSANNGTSWTAVNNGLVNTNVFTLVANGSYLFAGTIGGGILISPLP